MKQLIQFLLNKRVVIIDIMNKSLLKVETS